MRFTREPSQDRRIARGDDFAGDAWKDQKYGEITHVVVGHNPNQTCPMCDSQDTDFLESHSGIADGDDVDAYHCNGCNKDFGV